MPGPRSAPAHRISIGGTAQITKAMQMVAASKMRKAQQAGDRGGPFAQHAVSHPASRATTRAADFAHPLLDVREVRRRAVILIAADKGLCGGAQHQRLPRGGAVRSRRRPIFIAAGRKAAQFVAQPRGRSPPSSPTATRRRFPEARAIAAMARDLFLRQRGRTRSSSSPRASSTR